MNTVDSDCYIRFSPAVRRLPFFEMYKQLRAFVTNEDVRWASITTALNERETMRCSREASLSDSCERLHSELQIANNNIDIANELLDEKTNQITAFSTEVTTLRNTLAAKERELTLAKSRIADLTAQVNQKDATLRQKNQKIADLMQQISNINGQIDRLSGDIRPKMGKIVSSKKEEEIKKKIDGLRTSIQLIQTDQTKLKAEVAALTRQRDELNCEGQLLAERIGELSVENAALRTQISIKDAEITRLQEEKAQLELHLFSAREEIGQLQTRMKSAVTAMCAGIDANCRVALGQLMEISKAIGALPDVAIGDGFSITVGALGKTITTAEELAVAIGDLKEKIEESEKITTHNLIGHIGDEDFSYAAEDEKRLKKFCQGYRYEDDDAPVSDKLLLWRMACDASKEVLKATLENCAVSDEVRSSMEKSVFDKAYKIADAAHAAFSGSFHGSINDFLVRIRDVEADFHEKILEAERDKAEQERVARRDAEDRAAQGERDNDGARNMIADLDYDRSLLHNEVDSMRLEKEEADARIQTLTAQVQAADALAAQERNAREAADGRATAAMQAREAAEKQVADDLRGLDEAIELINRQAAEEERQRNLIADRIIQCAGSGTQPTAEDIGLFVEICLRAESVHSDPTNPLDSRRQGFSEVLLDVSNRVHNKLCEFAMVRWPTNADQIRRFFDDQKSSDYSSLMVFSSTMELGSDHKRTYGDVLGGMCHMAWNIINQRSA